MQKYESIGTLSCAEFKRLTGVQKASLEKMVSVVKEAENRQNLGYARGLKKCRGKLLTKEEKKTNRDISSKRVLNEHIIGRLKRFKILSDKYRNRRRRFGLRFNLIAGILNWELKNGGGNHSN